MQKRRTLSRRDFTLASALAVLSGVTITVSACGGSSSPAAPTPTTPPPTGGGDKVGTVSTNHGHTAVITAAELTAGGDVALDIQGTADHSHAVLLSAAEVMAIAADQRVSKESDTEQAHSHTVTFN